jgi:hypothetical protein
MSEPRLVKTGWRHQDRVQVLDGLKEGEQIVVSGTFLVDSESRIASGEGMPVDRSEKDPVCGMDVDIGRADRSSRGYGLLFLLGIVHAEIPGQPGALYREPS